MLGKWNKYFDKNKKDEFVDADESAQLVQVVFGNNEVKIKVFIPETLGGCG